MLSKIIERSSGHCEADLLPLERVNVVVAAGSKSQSPDAAAMAQRVAQLEKSLVETEAAAYARGRREAEAEAQQRYSAAMQNTAERLAQSVKQLADVRPRLCKEAEADLLRLALAIAQRVLHRELNVDPTALHALVQLSLDRLGRQEKIRVRTHPALAELVRAMIGKLSSRPIDVASDSALEPGGLVFESNREQLDASIHSQLDEIERGLVDQLEKR